MTDNEIIKVLECCHNGTCSICPYVNEGYCGRRMISGSLDLIKRQQEEIDRLKMLFNDQQEIIADLEWTVENEGFKHLGKMYSELRVEAIKEFAQELKDRTSVYSNTGTTDFIQGCIETVDWFDSKIDNLVKEMGRGE